MRRVLALALLSALTAACSDLPTVPSDTPTTDLAPQFAVAVGSQATWNFKGEVFLALGGAAQVGDIVEGQITFTILSDDTYADPCVSIRDVETSMTYILNGQTQTVAGVGRANSYMSCKQTPPIVPSIALNSQNGTFYWQFTALNPADDEDFPLAAPAQSQAPRISIFPIESQVGFAANLTAVVSGPQTKADCMKGGWEAFGFKNQGQCVRQVETGKSGK